MLPTIIFGLALLFSGLYVFTYITTCVEASITRRTSETGILSYITFFGAIVLWTWLYYLTF